METQEKITDRDAIKLLGTYFGCKAQIIASEHGRIFSGFLNDVSVIANNPHFAINVDVEGPSRVSGHAVYNISLLVKPLKKISDEDAVKVCELYNTHLDDIGSKKEKIRVSKDLILCVINCTDKFLNPFETLAMFDDLRELGYATPYKHYSVEDLIAAGIYKFID